MVQISPLDRSSKNQKELSWMEVKLQELLPFYSRSLPTWPVSLGGLYERETVLSSLPLQHHQVGLNGADF